MRRGLISRIENGRICDVVEVGSEFEITEDFFWMDVPDDTTTSDTVDMVSGEIVKFDPIKQPGFAENAYKVARAIAYTEVGNQLDMIFRELKETGTLSPDGEWFTHVANVKAAIPKDDPQKVLEHIRADWEARFGNQNQQ